jgi:hypothetical protein
MLAKSIIAWLAFVATLFFAYVSRGDGDEPEIAVAQLSREQSEAVRDLVAARGPSGSKLGKPIFCAGAYDCDDYCYDWAEPYDCFGEHPKGAPPPTSSPQDRLFLFSADGLNFAGEGRLICTIPWDGRELLLKSGGSGVFVRKTKHDPWRLHHGGWGKIIVLNGYPPLRMLGIPYSISLALPIDREVVSVLKTVGIKEVVVRSCDPYEDKAEEVFDVSPLAELPLESLVIEMSDRGKPSVNGLDKLTRLQSLAVGCFKDKTFPLGLLKGAAGIKYLCISADRLDCDVDPRVFSKLSYCRFRLGEATGMRRFVEGVVAERLHLGVQVGLAELAERTTLSLSVKHLRVRDSRDLKDLSCIKASPNLQELEIVGCKFLKDSDGFRKPAAAVSPSGKGR